MMRRRWGHGATARAALGRRRISGRLGRLWLAALAVAGIATLLAAAGAQASNVTVGSPLSAVFATTTYNSVATVFNTALPEAGTNVTSPVTGAVVRWRITGASGGPFTLRVLTPAGGTSYTGAGTSSPQMPTSTATQIYTTNLPIHAGQVIGLNNANGSDTLGVAGVVGATWGAFVPPLLDSSTSASAPGTPNSELGFNAEVQPAPSITTIGPPEGSVKGGASVVIAGSNLDGASAVKFGATPATSFTVNSENAVTAVSPPSATPGAVDISVTTVAGTTPAVAADRFTYTACLVPNLKGKKLKAARKALTKADCKLGKIKGEKSKSAKVIKQNPKHGKVLPPGAQVNVKLTG
jgi:hypothetical protein